MKWTEVRMRGEEIKTVFERALLWKGKQKYNSHWRRLWSPFAFFNAMLECSKEGENDDQGTGRERWAKERTTHFVNTIEGQ